MSSSSAPRVVVTGIGAVSGWGWGCERFWRGICSQETSIAPFRRFDTAGFPTQVAAEVPDPGPERRSFSLSRHLSWADRFAVAAATEAVAGAGLLGDLSATDAGVYFGSSTGGMFESELYYETMLRDSERAPDLRLVASQQVSRPGEAVARYCRVTGPVESISSACSSSTLALGIALEALREGLVRFAVAGGADSLCRITYGGFNALRSVDPRPTVPFRSRRNGLSLGEGGAVLVLETEASATERGAIPLAVLAGAGTSCDAHHMTAPDPRGDGVATAVRLALDDAHVAPDRVDFLNAHGTGTALNDAAEFAAYRQVFGERASTIPVSATKSSVGHLLGSAGAIEAVATVLSLREQVVPPAPGSGEIDPETPVRLVRERPLETTLDVGVTLNMAFGGCNGALVFSRWTPP